MDPTIRILKDKNIKRLRERILKKQGGVCAICGREPKIACLDHHHKKRIKGTGLVRGVCCHSCNVLIAKSENNCIRCGIPQKELPFILRKIADYLEQDHYPYLHPSEIKKILPPTLMKRSYTKMIKKLKTMTTKNGKRKFRLPDYPKSGRFTNEMKTAFGRAKIPPDFYKTPKKMRRK